jgi:hypothetical protein
MKYLFELSFYVYFLYVLFELIFWKRNFFLQNPFHPLVISRIFGILLLWPFVWSEEVRSYGLYLFMFVINIILLNHLFGFLFGKKKLYLQQASNFNFNNKKLFAFLLVLGWIARLQMVNSGIFYGTHVSTKIDISNASNFYFQLSQLSFYGLIGLVVFFHNIKSYILALLIIMEIIWLSITGTKLAIFQVLIPVILILLIQNRLVLSLRKISIIFFAGIFVLLIVFDFIPKYRVEVTKHVLSGDLSVNTIFSSVDSAISSDLQVNQSELGNALNERINFTGYLGRLIDNPISQDRWYGESLISSLTWYIPRIIWEEKPSISIGRWYAVNILGWDNSSRSEASITIWGDGYMNFGVIGVMLFHLFYLALFYLVYQVFLFRGGMSTYFSVLSIHIFIFSVEQNMSVILVKLQFLVVLCYLIKKWNSFNWRLN